VLYELMTGRPPFQGDSPVAIAYQHVREEPTQPSQLDPSIPQWANAIALKALAKDPNYRYQSAAEMRADIQRASQGMPVSAPTMAMNAGTQVMHGAGPQTQATRPATMGYDLPPVDYAEPEGGKGNGNGKKIALWAIFGLLAVGAIIALVVMFTGGGGGVGSTSTTVTMPGDIVGSDETTAKQELTGLGFQDANIKTDKQTDNNVARGQIIKVDPVAQTKIDKTKVPTTQVTLTISTGKPKKKIPSVKGLSKDEATSKIEGLGFQVGNTDTRSSMTVPKGNVIGTTPSAGSSAEVGSDVTLIISDGPGKTLVPNEVGKQLADAKAELRGMGFSVSVNYVDSQDQSPNTVLQQTPQEGDSANKGSTVTLTVARQPQQQPSTPPPSFPPSFPPGGNAYN
jgi:serine/threonine-protein kinase